MKSLLRHYLLGLIAAVLLPLGLRAQPANDDCAGAIELIPGITCAPVAGTVLGATQSIPGTVTCDGFAATPDDDVWYRFTATATAHSIQVDGDGTFDAVIQLLSGGCNGTPIVCRDVVSGGGIEVLDIGGLAIGQQYLIRVFDWFATPPATPTFSICVGPSAIPANDDCVGAITLVPNPACIPVSGTVALATGSLPGTVNCDGFAADPNDDVWYRFVATDASHTITVAPGASFDAAVQLLAGACNGTPILCRDLVSAGQPEVINATGLTVGAEYLIRVFHWFTAATTTPGFTICVQGPEPACTADASTLSPNRPEVCFDNGPTFIDAAFDAVPNVPAGYEVLHLLTTDPDLTIIATSTAPEFNVDALGNYVIHTLVYDPTTLDLSGVVLGTTQAGEVLAQLIQGGGTICASLDVDGAPVAVIDCTEPCAANAGTITADNATACLVNGTAELSATPDGNANVPDGYATLFVLTVGGDLTVVDAGAAPSFSVTDPGGYTIHTLVYDPTTFDLGVVELGVTTGGDVLAYIASNSLCASLDAVGAPIDVEECLPCTADAGTLTADVTPVCLENGAAEITATPDGNSVVPDGFEVLYVLTQSPSLTIQAVDIIPVFTVSAAGDYIIHTLVYDPGTLDLSVVEFGVTTGFDVLDIIAQNGICASLDATGAPIVVEECLPCTADAGTLTADVTPVCLENGAAEITATPDGNSVVPDGFEVLYVLTQSPTLTIQAVDIIPVFTVNAVGDYIIHTLVYDPGTLDLSVVEFGVTTGFDVLDIIAQNGICASLDAAGAPITVEECSGCAAFAGSITADDPTVCLDMDMAVLTATPGGDAVVPDGYEVVYVLTQGAGLVIIGANTSPDFVVDAADDYTIHTLVYDPATLDLGLIEFGVTTGFEVNALLIQGGGEVCASLDVAGAAFEVQVCIPCDAAAGTLVIDESPVCLFQGTVQVGASTVDAPVVPDGYEVAYALTQGPGLIIVALSGGPVFTVSAPGTYAIHTLVYDPNTLDPSLVELGFTSATEILALLVQGGGSICGSLDLIGAAVVVNDCGPANDECINAAPLSVYLDGDCPANAVAGDNTYATFSGGDAGCDDAGSYLLDVWYTFNSGANTSVTITLDQGTMEDWAITVMDACDGNELACEILPTGGIDLVTDPFTDYLVRVYSNFTFGNGGSFTICLTGAEESLVCDGGDVQTSDGFATVDICQDTEADVIDFVTTSVSAEDYTFILADANDIIVAVLAGSSLDFNSAPLGSYHVWGVSHNGALVAADPGSSITGVSSEGTCFGLSSNFVQVNVELCDGVSGNGSSAWSLFPNPGNGDFTLVAAQDGDYTLEMLDLDGRVVARERRSMSAGERQAFEFKGSLARGVYSVRIISNAGRATLRMVVQ